MHPADKKPERRFQFRLATIFALTAAVAVLCLVAPPVVRHFLERRREPETLLYSSLLRARTATNAPPPTLLWKKSLQHDMTVRDGDDPSHLKHLQHQQFNRAIGKSEVLPERTNRSIVPRQSE